MANQTTIGPERTTPYIDQTDNILMKMILPFIIGLALGWGANEIMDGANKANSSGERAQTESRSR